VIDSVFLSISVRLLFTSISAILAIVLWSRTREGAWLFIILGIVSLYLETVFSIFQQLGLLQGTILTDTAPLISIIFGMLPSTFFITAFITMLAKTR
jgi:hypothetical protein